MDKLTTAAIGCQILTILGALAFWVAVIYAIYKTLHHFGIL